MTIDPALFAVLWMVFVVGVAALFSVLLVRNITRRADRRRQQHPAE
jgi:hypothetical protein